MLRVRSTVACSHAAEVLQSGDMILAMEGKSSSHASYKSGPGLLNLCPWLPFLISGLMLQVLVLELSNMTQTHGHLTADSGLLCL